jgi:pimeloyl-ACP methyl ester carboxylesterase
VRTCELAGTPVVYQDYGDGPSVVIVHGLNSYAHDWRAVAKVLESAGHRVLVPYRRGRAPSGPLGDGYSLATEVADLSALLDVAGPGATLVGHSFGGLIALLTARSRPDIGTLVLYEPPVPGYHRVPAETLAAMGAALLAGDRDTALAIMITEVDGDPPERVTTLRASPEWTILAKGLPTVHTELTAFRATPTPDLAGYPVVPTTVLLGEVTEPRFGRDARAVLAGLPHARLVMLPGHGHIAHSADPELLASLIRKASSAPA